MLGCIFIISTFQIYKLSYQIVGTAMHGSQLSSFWRMSSPGTFCPPQCPPLNCKCPLFRVKNWLPTSPIFDGRGKWWLLNHFFIFVVEIPHFKLDYLKKKGIEILVMKGALPEWEKVHVAPISVKSSFLRDCPPLEEDCPPRPEVRIVVYTTMYLSMVLFLSLSCSLALCSVIPLQSLSVSAPWSSEEINWGTKPQLAVAFSTCLSPLLYGE